MVLQLSRGPSFPLKLLLMPKVQKLRKYRASKQSSDEVLGAAKEKLSKGNDGENTDNDTRALSKGQKKRRQKRASVMVKLGKMEPNLKFSASAKKEKRDIFNSMLSELESSLPTTNSSDVRPAAVSAKSNKLKKSLAVRETQRMKLVQQHPAFVENATEAVRKHIEHMLATKQKYKS